MKMVEMTADSHIMHVHLVAENPAELELLKQLSQYAYFEVLADKPEYGIIIFGKDVA